MGSLFHKSYYTKTLTFLMTILENVHYETSIMPITGLSLTENIHAA